MFVATDIAGGGGRIDYVRDKGGMDAEERARRIALYAQQVSAHCITPIWFKFGPAARPVECIDTGLRYNSASDAARQLGLVVANVRAAIRQGTRSGGLRFRHVPGSTPVKLRTKRERAVKCIDTGEQFLSISDAARAHSTPISSVFSAIKYGKTAHGRRYAYAA